MSLEKSENYADFFLYAYIKKNIHTCDRKGLSIQIIKVVNDLNVKAPRSNEKLKRILYSWQTRETHLSIQLSAKLTF